MLTVECKPANRISWLNAEVLTLTERLERVMTAMNWAYPDLVRESGESRSVVSQWLGRGSKAIKSIGKMEAAERLEAVSGFSALWIAKGVGPERAADVRRGDGKIAEMVRNSATLKAVFVVQVKERADLTPQQRAELLAALEPGQRHRGH